MIGLLTSKVSSVVALAPAILLTSCNRESELVFAAGSEEVVVSRDGEVITIEEFENYIGDTRNSEVPVIILDKNEHVGTVSAAEISAALKKQNPPTNNSGGELIEVHIGDFNYGKWPPD